MKGESAMTDLLDRWGLIAGHLKVSEKTAIRYKKRGLPVTYDPAGHPIATKQALDHWKKGGLEQQTA